MMPETPEYTYEERQTLLVEAADRLLLVQGGVEADGDEDVCDVVSRAIECVEYVVERLALKHHVAQRQTTGFTRKPHTDR